MKNLNFSENPENAYLKNHLSFAAGACFPRESSTNRWKYENLQKSWKNIFNRSSIICRRRVLAKKCSTNVQIWKCFKQNGNNIWKLIYTLPQALVSLENLQQIVKNMKVSKNTWKSHSKAHPYSAAGAFLPKECSKIHEIYVNL